MDAKSNSVLERIPAAVQLGKLFRQEVVGEYHKQAEVRAKRQYQIHELCHKYFPLDSSLDKAKEILQAAGHEGPLYPAYNRQLPSNSIDRQDLGGGFNLFGSAISNTSFSVIFRPSQNAEKKKHIESIVSCVITDISL